MLPSVMPTNGSTFKDKPIASHGGSLWRLVLLAFVVIWLLNTIYEHELTTYEQLLRESRNKHEELQISLKQAQERLLEVHSNFSACLSKQTGASKHPNSLPAHHRHWAIAALAAAAVLNLLRFTAAEHATTVEQLEQKLRSKEEKIEELQDLNNWLNQTATARDTSQCALSRLTPRVDAHS